MNLKAKEVSVEHVDKYYFIYVGFMSFRIESRMKTIIYKIIRRKSSI